MDTKTNVVTNAPSVERTSADDLGFEKWLEQAEKDWRARPKPDFKQRLDEIRNTAANLQSDVENLTADTADLVAELEELEATYAEADCDDIGSAVAAAQRLDWAVSNLSFDADEVVDNLDEAIEAQES